MHNPPQQPPHDPACPVEPLDYRPHSEEGAARRWPLWLGLVIVTVLVAAVLLFLMADVAIKPPAVKMVPATQPAWPAGPAAPPTAMTQPATDESPGR